MIWVLDTNIISELRRPKPDPEVVNWITKTESKVIWTSRVCLAEIQAGITLQPVSTQRTSLEEWYGEVVLPMFEEKIFEVDEGALKIWLNYLRIAKANQSAAPPVDFLIAAICKAKDAGIATRDFTPYVDCGVPTLNPFTGERFNGA